MDKAEYVFYKLAEGLGYLPIKGSNEVFNS
mgnify:CR=1 FL=1